MRFLAVPFAALSLTACFGTPGEPLSGTEIAGQRDSEVTTPAQGAQLSLLARGTFLPSIVQSQPSEPTFRDEAIAEVAATVEFAAERAYAAADAGLLRDKVVAEQAAIDLASAAALVSQRAQEMQAFSTAEGGCGSEVGGGEISDADVNNAVALAALAAESAGEIAGELDPPATTVCGSGCGATCEEVPGTVNEVALNEAIGNVEEAAAGCADAGAALNPQ